MERVKGLTWNPKGYWQYAYKPVGRKRTSTKLGGLTRDQVAEANQRAREFLEQEKAKVATVSFVIAQYRKTDLPKNPVSRQNYEALLRRIERDWGPVEMKSLLTGKIKSWILNLTHLGNGRDLAPGTQAEIRNQFTRLWEYAIDNGLVPGLNEFSSNPARRVKIPDSTKVLRETKPLELEQFKRWTRLLKRPFLTMLIVGIAYGLRISEVLALKWSDVDWFKGELSIERRISRRQVATTKTEASEVVSELKPRMMAELKRWRQETRYAGNDDWVFASPSRRGKDPISVRTVENHFTATAKEIGLKRGNTHIMRHTHRWLMRLKGIPEKVQQEAMRLTNLETLQRYGKEKMPEVARAAQGLVADMLFQALDEIADEKEMISGDFRPM